MGKQNHTKDMEDMARIYSPRGEKIGFVRVMELKSDMETGRHSKNLGDRS